MTSLERTTPKPGNVLEHKDHKTQNPEAENQNPKNFNAFFLKKKDQKFLGLTCVDPYGQRRLRHFPACFLYVDNSHFLPILEVVAHD